MHRPGSIAPSPAAASPWVARRAPSGLPTLARLFPLGLIATGYLSELLDPMATALAPVAPLAPTGSGGICAPAPLESGALTAAAPASMDRSRPSSPAPASAGPSTSLLTGSPSSAVEEGAAPLPAAMAATLAPEPWTARLLWVGPTPDDGVALWLRDYRLDPRDIASVGEALARESQAAGHPVRKVYLNGHLVWSASTSSSSDSGV